jgi:hypothetical protein
MVEVPDDPPTKYTSWRSGSYDTVSRFPDTPVGDAPQDVPLLESLTIPLEPTAINPEDEYVTAFRLDATPLDRGVHVVRLGELNMTPLDPTAT